MSQGTSKPPASGGGASAVRAFFAGLLRLILVLLVGVVLGGVIYFGSVFIYQRAIIPAEENAARLSALETEQAGRQALLREQLATLQSRLSWLESTSAIRTDLEKDLNSLQTQVAIQQTRSADLYNRLQTATLQVKTAEIQAQQVNRALGTSIAMAEEAKDQVEVLRAALHVLRARQHLVQGNYGLAQGEIETARQILRSLWERVPEAQQASIERWIARLELAQANLPNFPVAAADDLDVAWQWLLEGLPSQQPTPTPRRTYPVAQAESPTTALTPTLTPVAPTAATATPQPSPTATALSLTPGMSPSPSPTRP